MPTQLLISPAASGKTRYAIQYIHEILATEPLAPITVILPNQIRVTEFRRRLASVGGAIGVELVTFHSLYAEILARAGQPRARLLDPVQVRLLRAIVDRLCREGQLKHYAPLRTKPGFIAALRTIIEELKRARIEPAEFSGAVIGMGARLQEIAAAYSAYQDWLLQQDWADPEGQGWLAALALEAGPNLESGLRLLVVNGFDEFNPTQLGVLALLAQKAAQTLITLTGDLDRPHRQAHRRFHRAQAALISAIGLSPTPLIPPSSIILQPSLAYLETNLFEFSKDQPQQSESQIQEPVSNVPQFIEAQTRSAESRAALRWIKSCLVEDDFEISDVAILARDLSPYRPFLEEAAAEFGVPLRILGGLPLAENPAVAALFSLLSIPALDWPRKPVLRALQSPYFDWTSLGITSDWVATLDAITRSGRVISGLAQWKEAFDLLPQQKDLDDIAADEDGFFASSLPWGDAQEAGTPREKFDAFTIRLTPPLQARLRDYVAFIEDLIGDDPVLAARPIPTEEDPSLKVISCCRANPATSERDVAALRAFKDVLRGLVLAESVLGTGTLNYSDFFTELRGAVESSRYSALPEAGVLVASVLDARGLSFRAVAILGLSEGEFPRVEREDPFLSEVDRSALRKRGLPLETKLRGDEASLFYQAVTRARERLLLSRPYLADDGQPWEPSPYWQQVRRMFGGPMPQRVRPGDPLPAEKAASPIEFALANGEYDFNQRHGLAILWSRWMDSESFGLKEGVVSELSASLANHYSPSFAWSASKLESYGTCPFYFYLSYTLDLEPRIPPEEGYDVRILGSMLHKILELTYARAADHTDPSAASDQALQECLGLMQEIAVEVFATAPADYGFRPTQLWDRQQEELTRILQQTITALADLSKGFTPRYFEAHFGGDDPPLILHTKIGDVRLGGYIDRVDVGPDRLLRIIDYKAGSSTINSRNLDEGRRLQLPLYALAARDALGLGEIGGGFYWHIQKAEASSLKLEKYPGGVQAAIEKALQHVASDIEKIRAGYFAPTPPKDGCPKYCPATGFCWRYDPKGF